jgi:altronate dehydratase
VQALNQSSMVNSDVISRFVTLPHTEGCGSSVNKEFKDTLLGYLDHSFVTYALLLEHGCEITHNGYFRNALLEKGYNPDDYGWASIQLDGGIQSVVQHMTKWFQEQLRDATNPELISAGLDGVKIALTTHGSLPDALQENYVTLTKMIVGAGGTVLLHEQDELLKSDFMTRLTGSDHLVPTLGYAQPFREAGLHIMSMPTRNWAEILAGVGASGVELILSHIEDKPLHGHPLIPVLQVSHQNIKGSDVIISGNAVQQLLDCIVDTLSRRYKPNVMTSGNVYFQVTRGLLGVSL